MKAKFWEIQTKDVVMKSKRSLSGLILSFVALALMPGDARGGQGDELPSRFELIGGGFGERNGVFQGKSLVEIGPDGKLWLLGGRALTIDPVDGIFFNGDDVLSTLGVCFPEDTSRNGALFTPDGAILNFRSGISTMARLRHPLDGIFFQLQ